MSPRQRSAAQPRLVRPRPPVQAPPEPAVAIDRNAPCYVQLGRFGDLVNLLPILRRVSIESGVAPYVVVARQYASLFDGVSYVRPVLFGDDWGAVIPAFAYAKEKWNNPIVTQVRGHGWEAEHKSPSWNLEQHRLAGFDGGYIPDRYPRILFDRRNYARERKLIDQVVPISEKPLLLLNLSGGVSSPLKNHAELQQRITKAWGPSFAIVDVARVRAERVFDLIGLCEIADCLVTSDTSLLHLAQATGVKTIAFLSDEGDWCESRPLFEPFNGVCRGRDVANQWAAVDSLIGETFDRAHRGIIHVHEVHEPTTDRVKAAQLTWSMLTGWARAPYATYKRDTAAIGDPRRLPYLRDVLEHGLNQVGDQNLLVLTNDDVAMTQDIDRRVRNKMRRLVMATGRRIEITDLKSGSPPLEAHCGRDIIVWRTEWLRRNLHAVPDFILGASMWDYWAAGEARRMVGITWDWHTDKKDMLTEIEPGAVFHTKHKPFWESGSTTFPSQIHNRNCYKQWLAGIGLSDSL